MKPYRDESGQMLVVVVLSIGLLLSFMALSFDVGQFLYVRRQLQTAADAAALAGSLEIQTCGSTHNCTAMQTAATSAMSEDGLANPTLIAQCASNSGTGLTLILNNGPCSLGSDPNKGNTQYVEAVVSMSYPTLLARLMGIGSVKLTARAEAGGGNPPSCLDVMDATAGSALTVNGGGSITSSCGVAVNSKATPALMLNGNITASSINVVGTVTANGGSTASPSPVTGVTAIADPFASLPAPTNPGCGTSTSSPYSGSQNNISVGGTVVFKPGTYCGGINLNSGATATFNAGTYIFTGAVNANSSTSITGNGVTFYFTSGSLTMNSGSHANLVAPTTGTYAGVLAFQPASDTSSLIINGDSTSVWQGAIYLPKAQLTINGGANLAAYTILDVDTLMVNSAFTLGSNYSSLPNGPPIPSSGAALAE